MQQTVETGNVIPDNSERFVSNLSTKLLAVSMSHVMGLANW
jgi:hypothetical protein